MLNLMMDIPEAWHTLDVNQWQGPILVVGGPSTGKSTFGRYLFRQLLENHKTVAYLDADLGQQELAPPSAICVALSTRDGPAGFPPAGPRRMRFVGSNSPRSHFIPLIVGLFYLYQFAIQAGGTATVVDTSGFIDPDRGATVLKWAKYEILRPAHVVAFQRETELEPILTPLRPLLGPGLHTLPVVRAVRQRTAAERQQYRAESYRNYFRHARPVALSYRHLAVFPGPEFVAGQLLALEDPAGFTLALAVYEGINFREDTVRLLTPWPGDGKIAALRLGKLRLNLKTYADEVI